MRKAWSASGVVCWLGMWGCSGGGRVARDPRGTPGERLAPLRCLGSSLACLKLTPQANSRLTTETEKVAFGGIQMGVGVISNASTLISPLYLFLLLHLHLLFLFLHQTKKPSQTFFKLVLVLLECLAPS